MKPEYYEAVEALANRMLKYTPTELLLIIGAATRALAAGTLPAEGDERKNALIASQDRVRKMWPVLEDCTQDMAVVVICTMTASVIDRVSIYYEDVLQELKSRTIN
jgi:hypothetical protein